MSQKIVLIDGHSILNRAFYGVPDLSNAAGLHTNAIYGFLNIMFKILDEEKPDFLTVAFDVHQPTFRHEIYKEYKGTRKPMPQELREQVPVMKEVLCAMDICMIEQGGLEADDLLGTIAKKAEARGLEVALISGDRDLLQIASEHIKIRIPKTKGNRTEIEDYYARDVEAAYQVDPIGFIDLKALMGDTADNIPGVPKVGAKTATELMVRFGSLDNIYAHVDEIEKNSIRESLKANRELADLSKVLATINTHADFPYSFEHAVCGELYTKAAYTKFQELEFKNLLGRFAEQNQAQNTSVNELKIVSSSEELKQVMDLCRQQSCTGIYYELTQKQKDGLKSSTDGQLSFDFSGQQEDGESLMFCLVPDKEHAYFIESGAFVTMDELSAMVSELPRLATYECKKLYPLLKLPQNQTSKQVSAGFFDAKLAAYLMNPLKNDYHPEDICSEHLSYQIRGYTEIFGKLRISDAVKEKKEAWLEYMRSVAEMAYLSAEVLTEKLRETQMLHLFEDIEMPLSYVLYRMECEGIQIRPEELKAYGDMLASQITVLEKRIYEEAGEEFNINSPKQLGEILFEKMKLPGGKKTKTGYSTAADVLEKLAGEAPVVKDILDYRRLAKLKSTYADGLAAFITDQNRIHTTFQQTITATGRISSTDPNLQNIPMRMEQGRRIRKVFVPKDGYLFTDADYSQIELRILAHMSEDQELIEAYHQDQDIHRITASKVFHIPFDEVTPLQRRNAKAVNFGIVYGISAFGLSEDLSISRKEANEYIQQYFETYPGIKAFLDKCVVDAKKNGYSVTMYGRRRPIPELSSSNFMQRQFGERVAMNAPIQGTAADIMKLAMLHVFDRMQELHLKSRLILQIHDELLIETAPDELETVKELLEQEMKQAASLSVELDVDLHTGDNWYEAK